MKLLINKVAWFRVIVLCLLMMICACSSLYFSSAYAFGNEFGTGSSGEVIGSPTEQSGTANGRVVSTYDEFAAALADPDVQVVTLAADIEIAGTWTVPMAGMLKVLDGKGHSVTIASDWGSWSGIEASDYATFRDISFGDGLSLILNQGGALSGVSGAACLQSTGAVRVEGCELDGAYVYSGSNSVFRDSTLSGLLHFSRSFDCLVENCTIETTDTYAVLLGPGSGGVSCDVVDSTLKGGDYGFYAGLYGRDVEISGSVVEGGVSGVYNEGNHGGGNITLRDTEVRSGTAAGVQCVGGGGIVVPADSTLTLVTSGQTGISLTNGGALHVEEDVSIVHGDPAYTVYRDGWSSCYCYDNLLIEFSSGTASSVGYCLANKVSASFEWGSDYLTAEVTLVCSDKPSHSAEYVVETRASVFVQPTCTEKGTTRYIAQYGPFSSIKDAQNIDALGHDYDTSVIEPSCIEIGYTERTCSRCGDSYRDSEVEALGHDITGTVQIKPVTCTEDGIDEQYCSRCGLTGITVIVPAFGHHYSKHSVIKEPTCTEEGVREEQCIFCDDVREVAIPALGHAWATEYAVDKPATCTEEGSESIHCTVCGAQQEGSSRVIAKPDHAYGEWVVTKEPTYDEQGSREKVCAICGDKVVESIDRLVHSKGWAQEGDDWFYYANDGTMYVSRWLSYGGSWYYFGADGKMVKDAFVASGKSTYYMNASGVMVTNKWVQADGAWYYFGADGKMVRSGWVVNGSAKYYMGADGRMTADRWLKLDGSWYFFGANGVAYASRC